MRRKRKQKKKTKLKQRQPTNDISRELLLFKKAELQFQIDSINEVLRIIE